MYSLGYGKITRVCYDPKSSGGNNEQINNSERSQNPN